MESLRGQLLIAGPTLVDPNFRRAIVLVAEHTEDGAMGLVLNRPAANRAVEVVPALDGIVAPDDVVWAGGPVQPQALVVLAEFDDAAVAGVMVFGDVGFLPSEFDADAVARATRRARAFAGYAGWSGGQLEAELEEGSWLLEPARAGDVFAAAGYDLWRDVVKRKGPEFRLLAFMPPDPSLN